MKIEFTKYQGTGNDFIIIDDREAVFDIKDHRLIQRLCHRKFGIGADGLILLRKHAECDFEMVYFNADGHQSSMCGNGGRCIVAFAKALDMIGEKTTFMAIDGLHEARIADNWVELKMADVQNIEKGEGFYCLDTGSPHYIRFVDAVSDLDVYEEGKAIRYSSRFAAEGINVNFVEIKNKGIDVATYERGVEDETLSCGTGVTAAALAYYSHIGYSAKHKVAVSTKGGDLEVYFEPAGNKFFNIWLCGPAELVFKGEIC